MLAFILALLVAQQGGVPVRGAGGTSSVRSLSAYGYDFGPVRRCAYAQSGTASLINAGYPVTATGCTATSTTPAATSLYDQATHTRCPSTAATANASASLRQASTSVWRGNAGTLGGFNTWMRWSIETDNGTTNSFAGLRNGTSSAALACVTSPANVTDGVFMTCLSTGNYQLCSNDNVGAATCIDLGANFACATVPGYYELIFTAQPNSSSIEYVVKNLLTGASASGSLTSDLPRNTVFLGWEVNACNGANAGTVTIGFTLACTTQR